MILIQSMHIILILMEIVMMMQLLIVLFKEETIGDDEIDFLEEMNINNDQIKNIIEEATTSTN